MGAANVELLVVADNAPVDGHVRPEHTVLDVGTELAQKPQTLRYGADVAAPFQINVRAIAVGQVGYDRERVVLATLTIMSAPQSLANFELVSNTSRAIKCAGDLAAAPTTIPRPDGAATGNDDDVVEPDVGALNGMQRACERLSESGVVGGDDPQRSGAQLPRAERPYRRPSPPGVRRLKPYRSCGAHIQYWPLRQ